MLKSVNDLPEGIEAAVILSPATLTVLQVQECVKKGIKNIVTMAGGFAESTLSAKCVEVSVGR